MKRVVWVLGALAVSADRHAVRDGADYAARPAACRGSATASRRRMRAGSTVPTAAATSCSGTTTATANSSSTSRRTRQQHPARWTRPRPADALSDRPPVGRVCRPRAEGSSCNRSPSPGRSPPTASRRRFPRDLKPDYNIDPFDEAAVNNSPPTIRFDEHGNTVQGPLATAFDRTASVGQATGSSRVGRPTTTGTRAAPTRRARSSAIRSG